MTVGLARSGGTSEGTVELVFNAVFLFVEVVHDGGQDGRFDLPHLGSRIFLSQDLVESTQTASQGGIEVVFDVVVSAK